MKKLMGIGAILALLLLSACTTTQSSDDGNNTKIYGEITTGIESERTR